MLHFWFDLFLGARTEILKNWIVGRNDDKVHTIFINMPTLWINFGNFRTPYPSWGNAVNPNLVFAHIECHTFSQDIYLSKNMILINYVRLRVGTYINDVRFFWSKFSVTLFLYFNLNQKAIERNNLGHVWNSLIWWALYPLLPVCL